MTELFHSGGQVLFVSLGVYEHLRSTQSQEQSETPELEANPRQYTYKDHAEDITAAAATTKSGDAAAGAKDDSPDAACDSVCAHFQENRVPFEFGTLICCPANTRVKFDPGIVVWYFTT